MVGEKWDALLEELRSSLHDVAIIVGDDGPDGRSHPFAQADFQPTGDQGKPMTVACLGAIELLLFYGDGRARWELDWADEDVKFVKDVVRAVCTGNSKEVHAPGRIHVEVSLPIPVCKPSYLAMGNSDASFVHSGNRARAAYRATSYAEGDNTWSHFVAKAIEAETTRREADHNEGQMYPSWGENLPRGPAAQGQLTERGPALTHCSESVYRLL